MLWLYLITVVLIFLLSFFTLKQDIFQPACLASASFVISVACAMINQSVWQYEYHYSTIFVIASALIVFWFVNFCCLYGIKGKSISPRAKHGQALTLIKIDGFLFACIILFELVTIVLYYLEVLSITGGGLSFSSMMNAFRMMTSYSTSYSVSTIVSQMAKLALVISYVFSYILINNCFVNGLKKNIKFIVPLIIYCVLAILTAERYNLLKLFIVCLFLFNILYHKQKGVNKPFKLKTLAIIAVSVVGFFVLFWAVKSLVGRTSDSDLIYYIAQYAGGSIPGLDYFLQNPTSAEIWGQETFDALVENLISLGLLDADSYISHLTFIYSNGVTIGNIYTTYRSWIHDFGFIGMFILEALCSLMVSVWYNIIKYKNPKPITYITYSVFGYSILLHSINEVFYSANFCLGFLITVIEIHIVMWAIKHVRFKHKRTKVSLDPNAHIRSMP